MRDNTVGFQRKFEDHFRGSKQAIEQRLKVYLSFLRPVAALEPGHQVLDLDCGRCEWLELLAQNGIPACGVDLDEAMVQAGREKGYEVITQDPLEALKAKPDNSLIAVSGFHLVDHLPFPTLKSVVTEAYRTLVSGGLMFMEAPSPERLFLGHDSSYVENTHAKLFPHRLFALIESAGFERFTILRLQEPAPISVDYADLSAVFWGASLQCSIVAQRAGDAGAWLALHELFARHWGVSLGQAVSNYNRSLETWTRSVLQTFDSEMSEQDAALAKAGNSSLEDRGPEPADIGHLPNDFVDQINALSSRVDNLNERLLALFNSVSWKLTAPLRSATQKAKQVFVRLRRPFFGILQLRSPASTSGMAKALSRETLSPLEREVLARLLAASAKNEKNEDPH